MTTIREIPLTDMIEHAQERGITLVCIEVHDVTIQGRTLSPSEIHPVWFMMATLDEATMREAIASALPNVLFVDAPMFQRAYEARIPPVEAFLASSPQLHTDEHPFCFDEPCPCHTNDDLFQEYIETPYQSGLITAYEAVRIFFGCHL